MLENIFIAIACSIIIFVMVILPIILTKKYNKEQEQKAKKYIHFDTSFGKFLWDDQPDSGYEAGIEWEFNPDHDKTCYLFFDTDKPARILEGGYEKLAMDKADPAGDIDLEITRLAKRWPEFAEILPGKCYRKLESILSDKKRIDTEIREAVVDHFWFKPDLIKENATRKELMDGLTISCITVSRDGTVQYCIYYAKDIYVEDLEVIVKEDGSKDIKYNTYD